jgi:protein SCO1
MHKVTTIWAAATLALTLTGCSRRPDGDAPARDDRSKGGAMWGANYFPNVPLVSHRGEHVRFFDLIKDKVVAVNFIYTKCADACPMETARMLEVQKLLGDRLGKDVFFYSISIDPANDTPARLNEYAALWHTGPGWTFLTGKDEDITLLRKKLGVYEADLKKKDHNLSLLIGNQKTGRWMKRSPYENPYVLATELGSWLHNWKLPSAEDRDYAKAPEVRNISTGEEFFRARCASCHTVGGGDKNEVDARRVGPDLLGVTKKRERAWLERWMMHPDQMLAEKDPIATQLFAQYNNVVMPNLRLSKADVDGVLSYLDEETRVVEGRGNYVRAAATVAGHAEAAPAATPAAPATPSFAGPLPERALAPARDLLAAYESMRASLAADDLAGARAQVATLADAAAKGSADAGPAPKALLDLGAGARAVGSSSDVDAARLAFGELSKQVVALLAGEPRLREGRFLFLCPMAKGYPKWVQTGPTLNNPYWGKRMLTCGHQLADWAILRRPGPGAQCTVKGAGMKSSTKSARHPTATAVRAGPSGSLVLVGGWRLPPTRPRIVKMTNQANQKKLFETACAIESSGKPAARAPSRLRPRLTRQSGKSAQRTQGPKRSCTRLESA